MPGRGICLHPLESHVFERSANKCRQRVDHYCTSPSIPRPLRLIEKIVREGRRRSIFLQSCPWRVRDGATRGGVLVARSHTVHWSECCRARRSGSIPGHEILLKEGLFFRWMFSTSWMSRRTYARSMGCLFALSLSHDGSRSLLLASYLIVLIFIRVKPQVERVRS